MPASPPRRLFRLYRTVAAPGRVHDLRFEDYRGCDTRVASHLLRMACRHVRREDQQIAFRIVAVKCVAAIGRSLAARRQRQHMVFFRNRTIRASTPALCLASCAPVLSAVSSGFPVFPVYRTFPGRSCLFPGFSGCLVCFPDGFRPRPAPGPVIERFLIPAFRHVGRQMSLACRCGHFPLLFRRLRCCRLRDDERIELRDALPVLHLAVQFGHDTVAHEFECRAVLVRDRFGRFLGDFQRIDRRAVFQMR